MNASKVRLIVAYSVLWVVYLVSTFILFPTLNISCVIPVILIVGIGAWTFGTTVGLIATLVSLVHNFFLTGIVYANIIDVYHYTLTGYILLPTISYLLGHLRINLEALKDTKRHLDKLVAQRTTELNSLTAKLLENSEHLKNTRGQKLHDGIGQQLTGIQLMSSSISEQLLNEDSSTAAIADTIYRKSATTHAQVRQISRFLFPIKIGQVDFQSALNELASALEDIKSVKVDVSCALSFLTLPPHSNIQLYRICQEEALFIIKHEHAKQISINLETKENQRRISIKRAIMSRETESRPLITDYRIKMASGSFREFIHSGSRTTEYRFPLTVST